jgi:hypothetical protein
VIVTLPKPQLQPLPKSGHGWNLTFTGSSEVSCFPGRATNLPVAWTALTNVILVPATVSNCLDANPPDGGTF